MQVKKFLKGLVETLQDSPVFIEELIWFPTIFPWHLYLINSVEDIIVFLAWQVFNYDGTLLVFNRRSMDIWFTLDQLQKAFKGTVVNRTLLSITWKVPFSEFSEWKQAWKDRKFRKSWKSVNKLSCLSLSHMIKNEIKIIRYLNKFILVHEIKF